MTQGNCCRMAVGTRPDSAAQGRTRPPPHPPPPPPPPPGRLPTPPPRLPPLPLQRARVPSEEPLPRGPRGSRGGGGGGWSRAGGESREGRARGCLGLGLPAPRAPRDRRLPRPGALFFLPNYLSEQRAGGGRRKGPPLREGLPISIRGARSGRMG